MEEQGKLQYDALKQRADQTDGMNTMDEMDQEMPEGLAFSMAMNHNAINNCFNMSFDQRKRVIEESRTVTAKEDMTQLIDRIATNSFQG